MDLITDSHGLPMGNVGEFEIRSNPLNFSILIWF